MALDELTREFLIESQEGLDRMERCLTELEERPQDAGLIGDIFRSVHTIKGTTGFLGFKRLEKLAHAGENLLGLVREGKLTADGPMITGLLQLLDGLRSILKTIEARGNGGRRRRCGADRPAGRAAGSGTAQAKRRSMLSSAELPLHAGRRRGCSAPEPPAQPAPAAPVQAGEGQPAGDSSCRKRRPMPAGRARRPRGPRRRARCAWM